MAEFDRTYASRAAGNTGLGLGIAGTALGLLNNNGNGNGLLGGIFGNGCNACAKDEKIDALTCDLMRERSERYTDQKICDLKSLMYDKFEAVNSSLCAQNVWNATNTSTINCLTNQLNQIQSLITYGIASDKVITANSSGGSTT